MKLLKYRLVLDVDIDPNGTEEDALVCNLRQVVTDAVNNGTLTGITPATVEWYSYSVKERTRTPKPKVSLKTYFGIMEVFYVNKDGKLFDREFLHFTFRSKYNGEEDCSQHDIDMWNEFWRLIKTNPIKSYEGCYHGSPKDWNFIRELKEINTDGIQMGVWVKSSPFFRDGEWLLNRE